MDLVTLSLALFVFMFTCFCILKLNLSHPRSAKLPPGPYPFPIIGNIFELGDKPHKSLERFSKIYGPLMSLKLGSITTIVVSSAEVAKQVLQKHDSAFSSRSVPDAAHVPDYHDVSVAWLPPGSQWRNLRKITKEHLFSVQKLDASRGLRREKIQELCKYVHECCISDQAVDIGEVAFTTTLNILTNTLFSLDFAHYNSYSSQEMKDTVCGLMKALGAINLSDFFPVLKLIDPQGIRRQAKYYVKKLFAIFDNIIDQRLKSRVDSPTSSRRNDLLDTLLDLYQRDEPVLCRKEIKGLLVDLLIAGSETSSVTLEWVMTALLRNPEKMENVRNELREVMGDNELIEESDISRLPYLYAVVKETFRLYPPGGFLLPHKAEADVEINGYIVPKNAKILISIWAIGRNSSIWRNPHVFSPERFFDCEIDIKGQNFELTPFGAGRRICPGLQLAYRMLHLMLASLIHKFDWKLEKGMKPEDIDMSESFGLTLKKAVPLKVVPVRI